MFTVQVRIQSARQDDIKIFQNTRLDKSDNGHVVTSDTIIEPVMWIRIRSDHYHFGLPDTDPYQ